MTRLLACATVLFSVLIKNDGLRAEYDPRQMTNLKATYIVNALNFIRWKEEDFPNDEHSHMELLVVGEDYHNIADRIEYLFSATDFKIKDCDCQIKVRKVLSLKDAENKIGKGCTKIALLLDSELKAWDMEKYPKISGTLIIGESSGYLRKGMILTLRKENNRLKLGVNLKKADLMNLEISAKLLGLNRIVVQE